MALKGKVPEVKEKRLKLFLYGGAGIGKTTAAIQFPKAYIIDTEKGSDHYGETIKKSVSAVFQSSNSDEIREELVQLLTTKHEYRTLIIDAITPIYNHIQEKWTRVFTKNAKSEKDAETQDFGMRYWGKVKSEFKSLQRILLSLDMNVIVTAHQKDVYGAGFSKLGVTFDSMKGDDYLYDLIFRLDKRGGIRTAITEKERAEIDKQKFPEEFPWSYENFCKYYGKEIIEKEATPIVMATIQQIQKLKGLLEIVKVDDDTQSKWLNKADVDDWSEMTGDQIQKCIDFLDKKLKEALPTESKTKETK